MPNPEYSPNHPKYYDPPAIYPATETLLSYGCVPASQEEKAVFKATRENLKAFLQSRVVDWTESPEDIKAVFGPIPGYSTTDSQRDARRQLSMQAREKLLNLAFDYQITLDQAESSGRKFGMLLERDESTEAQQHNEKIAEIFQNGTDRERGKLFDEPVKQSMEWLKRCLNGISDRELVENMKDVQKSLNIVMEAENILKMTTGKKKQIELSDETRDMLLQMKEQNVQMSFVVNRIRAIVNPLYEYVDIDNLLQINNQDFDNLSNRVEDKFPGMWDYVKTIGSIRNNAYIVRENNKQSLKDGFAEATQANKGFFIGSRAYSRALRAMGKVSKVVDAMGDPPTEEELERVKPMLRETIQKCDIYLKSKNVPPFKNKREEIRYNAMKRDMERCQNTLDFLDTKEKVKQSEALNFHRPRADMTYPSHTLSEVSNKIQKSYGVGKDHKGILPSDVGDAADELRDEIHQDLNKLMLYKVFDGEYAGKVMAKMVLLEMVKNGRYLNRLGKITAGPFEVKLAADHDAMIESIQNNKFVKMMTENVTKQMMEHFIMVDGAKNIADNMRRMVEQNQQMVKNEPVQQAQKDMGGIIAG